MISFKGAHVVQDIILTCVRWYLAYPLSFRQLEELMQERGVSVDHATIHHWVLKYSLLLEGAFHRRKRPVGRSWRMDETYIRVEGAWRYLDRAVDKTGRTIDLLLTEHQDTEICRQDDVLTDRPQGFARPPAPHGRVGEALPAHVVWGCCSLSCCRSISAGVQ